MLPVRFVRRSGIDSCIPRFSRWTTDLDHLFNDFLPVATQGGFRVDVHQEGEDLVIDAELPGLNKDQIEINIEDQVLTIGANYEQKNEDKHEDYYLKERRTGKVFRSFRLDSTADVDNISANLANGILTLRIPTREEAKPRKIEVN